MAIEGQAAATLLDVVHAYVGSRGGAAPHHLGIAPEKAVFDDGWQPVLVDDMVYLWL